MSRINKLVAATLLASFVGLAPRAAAAGVSLTFSYSGRMTEPNGRPVTGPVALKVSFYHEAAGGDPVLTVTDGLSAVPLQEGIFQVALVLDGRDFQQAFPAVSEAVYVEVTDLTHRPDEPYERQLVAMVPYAAKIPVDEQTITFNGNGQATLIIGGAAGLGKLLSSDGAGGLKWIDPPTTAVASVGGVSAENLATGATAANAATSASAADTIVKRDASGGFAAGSLSVEAASAATKAVVVKGAATQTANLQEWQASDGTVLSAIGADGTLKLGSANHLLSLKAATGMAADVSYIFPEAPEAGKFLTTDASGNLSWTTPAGGGDMARSTFDANTNGIVDRSEDAQNVLNGGARIGAAPAVATTVAALMNPGDTAVAVASTTGYATSGTLIVESEIVRYSGKTATTFTGLTRGLFGTAAASHSGGVTIGNLLVAAGASDTVKPALIVTGAGRIGVGTLAPGAEVDVKGALRLSGSTSGYVGLAPAAAAGSTTYTLPAAPVGGGFLTTDGSGVMSWGSPAGLQSFNGLNGTTQTLAVDATTTAPGWTSAGSSHTLHLPLASAAGVTAGLLSKTDYDSFAAKQAALPYTPADSVTTITAGTGLTGGGNLSANRTLSLDINGLTAKSAAGDDTDLFAIYDPVAVATKRITRANVLSGVEKTENKGAASGYPSLNGSSLVVQDPANAVTTAAGDKIPKANGSGIIDAGWLPPFVGDAGSGGTKGVVPAPATGDAAKFLAGDGTWKLPSANAILPSQTSNAGKVLKTDGTNVSWIDPLASAQWTTNSTNIGYTSGSVGIGTTSPATTLEIVGTTTSQSILPSATATYDLGSGTKFWSTLFARTLQLPGSSYIDYGISAASTLRISSYGGGWGGDIALHSSYGGAASMFVKGYSGKVGIGTTVPAALLELRPAWASETQLAGTVTVGAGSTTVTGTGTAFTSSLNVGDSIMIATEAATVAAIASDTSLTLGSAHVAGATGVTALTDPTIFAVKNSADVTKFLIDKTGNVGIGTTSPSDILHVAKNGTFNAIFQSTAAGGTVALDLKNPSQDWAVALRGDQSNNFAIVNNSGGNFPFVINTSGKVGIGNTAPTYALDVTGTVRATNFISTSGTSAWGSSNLNDIGSLGIGTTSAANSIGFGGNVARTIGMDRHSTVNTAGNILTIAAGGAASGATDKSGGDLVVSSGVATGTGASSISFKTATAQGSTATTDNTPTTKLTITGDGNVGVGTTSPSQILDLSSSSPTLRLTDSAAHTTSSDVHGSIETYGRYWTGDAANYRTARLSFIKDSGNGFTGGGMVFEVQPATGTNSVEKMRLTKDGSLGIGVTAPLATLDVNGPARLGAAPTASTTLSSGITAASTIFNVASTVGYPRAGLLQIGSEIVSYTDSSNGTQFTGVVRGLNGTTAAIALTGAAVNSIPFLLQKDGTSTPLLLVDGAGNVGIGTTSPTVKLDVGGGIQAYGDIKSMTGGISAASWTALVPGAAGGLGLGSGQFVGWDSSTSHGSMASLTGVDTAFSRLSAGKLALGSGTSGDFTGALIVGSVGVGTTNPQAKLDVGAATGSGASDVIQKYTWVTDTTNWGLRLEQQYDSGLGRIQYNWIMKSGTASDINVLSMASGNVGIGTTAPAAKLDVSGKAIILGSGIGNDAFATLGGGTGEIFMQLGRSAATSGALIVQGVKQGVGAHALALNPSSGNVGIGTTAPAGTLDINGSLCFAGANCRTSWPSGSDLTVPGPIGGTTPSTGAFTSLSAAISNTSTSGTITGVSITPTYNQTSGTAANTDLLVNRTQTAVGSGTQRLFDAQVGGTTMFNVSNTGNGYFAGSVGIGTTDPATPLDVRHTTAGSGSSLRLQNNSVGGYTELALYSSASASVAGLGYGNASATYSPGGAYFYTAGKDFSFSLDSGGSTALFLKSSNGNVGIGTTAPTHKLEVKSGYIGIADAGGTTGLLRLGEIDGKTGIYSNASTGLVLGSSGGPIVMNATASGTGNVGIGTTAPGNKLTVTAPTTADTAADVMIGASATTQKGLVVQGKASQTANLQEWQNSAGTALTYVTAAGRIVSESKANSSTLLRLNRAGVADAGDLLTVATGVAEGDGTLLALRGNGDLYTSGNVTANIANLTMSKATYTMMADAADSPYFSKATGTGVAELKNFGGSTYSSLILGANQAGNIGLTVKGAASQTADLQQWQSSTGTPLAVISASGAVGIGTTAPTERLDIGTGNIAMGWELINNTCAASTTCTATCTGTKRATGGGCSLSGGWSRLQQTPGTSSYECVTETSTSITAYVYCANIR